MFHPLERAMERGWVGRIDGDHVVHLAAQTLQAFFTGGGTAREHAVYPREGVQLLSPVLHPPSVRVFESETSFVFANPAAIRGPDSEVVRSGEPGQERGEVALELHPRVAAIVATDGEIGGFTAFAEWRDPRLAAPKDRDFALGLGPLVVTLDEPAPEPAEAVVRVDGAELLRAPLRSFDWAAACASAEAGTVLYPGDLLVGPAPGRVDGVRAGSVVELELANFGVLRQRLSVAG